MRGQFIKSIIYLIPLLICFQSVAAPKEYEWEKFGYANSELPGLVLGTTPFWALPSYATPAQACNSYVDTYRNIFPSDRTVALKVCPTVDLEISDCVDARQSCGPGRGPNPYTDGEMVASPVCSRFPLAIDPNLTRRGAQGRAQFNFNTNKCNCVNSTSSRVDRTLWPDHDTPYCYEPPSLYLRPSVAAYDRKAPDRVLKITTFVERQLNTILKNPDVKISVQATSGEPGKLSNQVLGADGVISFEYSFPSFTEAKTDTIVVTCEICKEYGDRSTLDIPMVPTLLGFFNGVWNTREQAEDGLKELKITTEAVRGKQNVAYDLFYNQTGSAQPGSNGVGSALTDVAEVFDQRSRELDGVLSNRWETFWDILGGRHANPKSGLGSLLVLLGDKALALAQLADAAFSATLGNIVGNFARLLSNPPTAADRLAHVAKLQKYADDGYPLVLVAHSQGNLFVNRAFDSLRGSRPNATAAVVHIAPASPTLRGEYVLADIDLVINGLRLTGINTVPNVNLVLPVSTQDASGHTLVATYLDASRRGLDAVKRMIRAAVDPL